MRQHIYTCNLADLKKGVKQWGFPFVESRFFFRTFEKFGLILTLIQVILVVMIITIT